MNEFNEHVLRLLQGVYRDTNISIFDVHSEPLSSKSDRTFIVRLVTCEEFRQKALTFEYDADPAKVAWRFADSIQDDVVESSHWGEPIPPCGLHPHHPARIKMDGPGGLTLECPYPEWSRHIT